jgi:uncharacterized protein YuzB (UPF0349 family)
MSVLALSSLRNTISRCSCLVLGSCSSLKIWDKKYHGALPSVSIYISILISNTIRCYKCARFLISSNMVLLSKSGLEKDMFISLLELYSVKGLTISLLKHPYVAQMLRARTHVGSLCQKCGGRSKCAALFFSRLKYQRTTLYSPLLPKCPNPIIYVCLFSCAALYHKWKYISQMKQLPAPQNIDLLNYGCFVPSNKCTITSKNLFTSV